jgi:hypothetical protein
LPLQSPKHINNQDPSSNETDQFKKLIVSWERVESVMSHGHDHQLDLQLLFKHLLHSQNGQDILAVISEITSYLYGIETKA